MIVEFIGSTGAGKTTLSRAVQAVLSRTTEVADCAEVVAELVHLPRASHPTAQNLMRELVGLPFFVRSLYTHREFLMFVWTCLLRYSGFNRFLISYLRSIERKIGTHEILRRCRSSRITVVDEGTLHSAHILFVYAIRECSSKDIDHFAKLVPLPDVVVYVRAPLESLIVRSLRRTDPPREMRSGNEELVSQYIRRAVEVFDKVVEAEEIRDRVITVENHGSLEENRAVTADRVAQFIINRRQKLELERRALGSRPDDHLRKQVTRTIPSGGRLIGGRENG